MKVPLQEVFSFVYKVPWALVEISLVRLFIELVRNSTSDRMRARIDDCTPINADLRLRLTPETPCSQAS